MVNNGDKRKRAAPISGTEVVWPAGVELRYGISAVTRWRWERAGKLPPRDLHIGGRSGWRPDTLKAAEASGKDATHNPSQIVADGRRIEPKAGVLYGISAAAQLVPCAEDTLRDLDSRGVIHPMRDSARRRLFTEADIKAARISLGREVSTH